MFEISPPRFRSSECRARRSSRGFTLIEVLVALTITSLVTTVLMGAIYYVLQVRVKLADEVQAGERAIRVAAWYRQIVSSALPLPQESPDVFEGSESGFRALVANPLSVSRGGAPELVELRLDKVGSDRLSLVYKGAEGELVLDSWQGVSDAGFEYVSVSGATEKLWKPQDHPEDHLPRAIRLNIRTGEQARSLFATISTDPWVPRAVANPFFTSGPGGALNVP